MAFSDKNTFLVMAILATLLCYGCEHEIPAASYTTKHVFIVVVDGPRYLETWGNATHAYIPKRSAMLSQGVLCSNFYNHGSTYTTPGHTAISTGNYETINNAGLQYPQNPSLLQYFLQTSNLPDTKALLVTSKSKLEVLADCTAPDWQHTFNPLTDCGVAGLGTGNRNDSLTFHALIHRLELHHPSLVLINFMEPDISGHLGDSLNYLKGIMDTDAYIDMVWKYIQHDPLYRNTTTLMVTNDHGRHSPGHLNGFVSHGDNCLGCRKIEFFAIGPDFRENYISTVDYEQIDISATIAELLNFRMPTSKGRVMSDIFR
jgi:hypothetical protein